MCFSAPAPTPVPVAPVVTAAPTVDDAAAQDAATAERKKRALAAGRASTILTGSGLEDENVSAGNVLLGG